MLAILAACTAAFTPQDVPGTIRSICARADGLARVEPLGESLGGRPIELVTLAAAGPAAASARPGILVLAGLDGRRPVDTALALDQLERLVDGHADGDEATVRLLTECVVWIVPRLNPDGFALGRHGNARALDLDRDGRRDEDAPVDLDGDGMIAHMRWPDGTGRFVVDPAEPRLCREADRDAGERRTHRYEVEARDADDDGERAEDDAHGVWIDRSFPHRWAEFDPRTGAFPTSEPATKALADFAFGHRNLVLAFVWGRDDNLLETPKIGKPAPNVQNEGILEGDEALFARAGALYRERTGRSGEARARMDGSPWAWLYLQVGVPALASDVWRVPELEGEAKDDPLQLAKRRLAQCEAAGRGFVPWRPFEHPELGAVEIGGFVLEDETALLPGEARDALFAAHHAFFLEAATWRPRCRIESFAARNVAGSAYELEAVVVNDGPLPALTATGARCRRFALPRLELAGAEILAGEDRPRVTNLGAFGGREEFRWIVTGAPDQRVVLELDCDPVGGDRAEVKL